ncbi:trypsin-like serine peptidase [Pseudooceanicola sp. LIPI14-2-Ac024]|uniref:trypsin-like serine peptidase n=1 Tax=Pseudooceanicola sp. LIPI14-2-Ac024 TaxID=3344875 RepID=UPI0035D05BC6
MLRLAAVIACLCLPLPAVAQGLSDSLSTHGALTRLDTGDQSRGWEAVGRLDIDGKGFCTGALIAEDLVLTAAHCLFDKHRGTRIDATKVQFLAGFRNGRASAYRQVKRAVIHPAYHFEPTVSTDKVRQDVALLQLDMPIRNTTVVPFDTDGRPARGDRIGVVSYAHDRAEAPSLQEICGVMGQQDGVLIMSCDVDFGSSGAPVFSFGSGAPRIVSVVSAKAEVSGTRVALGTQLGETLEELRAELDDGVVKQPVTVGTRIGIGGGRQGSGAKFVRAGE